MTRPWASSVLVGTGVPRPASIWGGPFLTVHRSPSSPSLVEDKVFIAEWHWWALSMGCFFIRGLQSQRSAVKDQSQMLSTAMNQARGRASQGTHDEIAGGWVQH